MRIVLATLALIATVNGFSFFGKKEDASSGDSLNLYESFTVAQPATATNATKDVYDAYV